MSDTIPETPSSHPATGYRADARRVRSEAKARLLALRAARAERRALSTCKSEKPREASSETEANSVSSEILSDKSTSKTSGKKPRRIVSAESGGDSNSAVKKPQGRKRVRKADSSRKVKANGAGASNASPGVRSARSKSAAEKEAAQSEAGCVTNSCGESGTLTTTDLKPEIRASLAATAVATQASHTAAKSPSRSDMCGSQHSDRTSECNDSSDLYEIPGIGPGLVWMFGQCNIASLRELAQADAKKLSIDLGLIGILIDIESWIEFAQKWQTGNS